MAGDAITRDRAILAATHHEVRRQIEAHEAQHHRLPPPRRRPIEAVMFPGATIPDHQLARMAETVEVEQLTLEEVAARFDYPPSLVFRELLAYAQLHQAWMVRNALAAGRG